MNIELHNAVELHHQFILFDGFAITRLKILVEKSDGERDVVTIDLFGDDSILVISENTIDYTHPKPDIDKDENTESEEDDEDEFSANFFESKRKI